MEIKGQLEDIIYQNEVNSYTIARFKLDEEDITTVVGYLPFVTSGDVLKLTGEYVMHQDYGKQFKISTFEKTIPEGNEAIEKYLANSNLPGIGPATAKKIVDRFGEDTIHVLKFEPHKLTCIKGITDEKAIRISEEFNENWELWQIVSYLDKFGITINNAKKVYDTLGKDAIAKIEANPYILIDIARGVDFNKIDKMAISIGIPYDSQDRIKSGIKYALILASLNGHCSVLEENLVQFVYELLGVNQDDIEDSIIDLKVKEELVIEHINDHNWVYLFPFYKAEKNIADKINILIKSKNIKKIKNFELEVKKAEEKSDIILSKEQVDAINQVNQNNVCIITGGPGTGKTTIIKTIIQIYEKNGYKVALCAPTGRAAKRMTETTSKEAKTLHRLLEIKKLEENMFETVDYETIPIDADVIVVDEMSMVDVFLMNYFIKAIYQGTKLILVGDVDQLPSVGPGSVLKDLINSEKIATVKLEKIFRQAAKSKIVLNAHKVNEGEPFIQEIDEDKDDFFYIKEVNQEKILNEVLTLCSSRLKKYGNYDFYKNIQVLSPTKKGILGTKELNKALQEELNPESKNKKERASLGSILRQGDRVMQIKNNYDIFWEKEEPEYESGTGVFNGELGTILDIDNSEKLVRIQFDDDKVASYEFSELDQIELAYSITIHKSQRK